MRAVSKILLRSRSLHLPRSTIFAAKFSYMSALRSSTARLLLERVKEDERSHVVQQLASSLDEESGRADVDLTATLLGLHHDDAAHKVLLSRLQRLIERGDYDQVAAVCNDHHVLLQAVCVSASKDVSDLAEGVQGSRSKWIAVATSPRAVKGQLNGMTGENDETMTVAITRTVQILHFLNRVGFTSIADDEIRSLLESCYVLVGASDKGLYTAAQETISSMLGMRRSLSFNEQHKLWQCIRHLARSTDVTYETIGFSLWLRWISSSPNIDARIFSDQEYWDLTVSGLRYGDSERRKAALQILKTSVGMCVQDPALISAITSNGDHVPAPSAVADQYARYSTVFETIILGRYLNQVMECEADLDFLSSSQSVVNPVWLYTLLTCAFNPKLQESNRKYIGTWIMASEPRLDDVDVYLDFFRQAFLPWVTGGHMFTSTLHREGELTCCEHGDRLALYIAELLQNTSAVANGVVDAILESVLSRQANNFAYAIAYLVEGIRQAYLASDKLVLSTAQLESIARIPTWAGLPEVSRDYILATSWNLSHHYVQRHGEQAATKPVTSSARKWQEVLERATALPLEASAHVHGNIASMALVQSNRDRNEGDAIQKVVTAVAQLESADQSNDALRLKEMLEDVFESADYLEYPMSLLTVLPMLVPHRRLVELALAESATTSGLDELLTEKVSRLLELAQKRAYLLAPIVTAVRDASLQIPNSSAMLRLDQAVIGLAEHPPGLTIDARLEDAIIPLLQGLDPGMTRFDHSFYFGPRQSYGYAALLDLVSRLGAVDRRVIQQVAETILERWSTQKVPAPSVSPWKTGLQLQVLLLALEQYLPYVDHEEAMNVVSDLYHNLSVEPLPKYRYLLEWMIARAYIHHPGLKNGILDHLRTKDHHSNPKFLASLMKLGVTLAKVEGSTEAFAFDLAALFVPMAASSKVVIRHEAQWSVPNLMDLARERKWATITSNTALTELDAYIRSLERFGDPPLERQIDKLDPVKDHTLTHLVEGPWYELDHVEQRQTSREDFVALYAKDPASLPPSCMPLGDPIPSARSTTPSAKSSILPKTKDDKISRNITTITNALTSTSLSTSTTALQTKGAAYLSSTRTRHTTLLVIASLVDNPYNLGGISRASEIFGAGTFFVPSTNVLSNKDFTSTSVSSHFHFPILPLPASDLATFLATKKREEGYKVVGIEQTDRSVILGEKECVLPEKCVLVLGSEREGIPAQVLGECDVLVEIRQVGITRSLNVQTAAGIVLCEYGRQHAKQK
ncbi:putative methyltransferase TARBP1 [Fulvia fulva]|nr:putative methyltransferase TARBP1 [Fulvia fulva]KAK4632674.1 putative methyltransferase TARBP1 [Fulvia fulva]WPV10450.1 putative methyltransferase TARBP1 [Fulvia fulva]WPV26322.1 putative methyltransferase TARBP1 [Fulvia fulva]